MTSKKKIIIKINCQNSASFTNNDLNFGVVVVETDLYNIQTVETDCNRFLVKML